MTKHGTAVVGDPTAATATHIMQATESGRTKVAGLAWVNFGVPLLWARMFGWLRGDGTRGRYVLVAYGLDTVKCLSQPANRQVSQS